MFVQDAFHHDFDSGARAFPQRPIDGHALLHLRDQLRRDELEIVIAHRLLGAVVGGKRLEQETLFWPRSVADGQTKLELKPEAFAMLTDGIDMHGAQPRGWYERVR